MAAKTKKRHYLLALIVVGISIVLLAMAIMFQKDIRQAMRPQIDKSDAKAVCTAEKKPDMNWRWYTKNYPGPSVKWQIFTTSTSLCLRINNKWKMFTIKTRAVKQYGCFDTQSGLFCTASADPNRHPKADEFLN